MKQRYLIEGTWSGYNSNQTRIVHREVTTDSKLIDFIDKYRSICYTDGTCLILNARPLVKWERVKHLRNSYGSLIRDCYKNNVTSVDDLIRLRKN